MVMSMLLFLVFSFPIEAAVKTGGIEIELKCYEDNLDGSRSEFKELPDLMPKEQISYVIAVENKGEDAWIRVHISYDVLNGDGEDALVDDGWLFGIHENWVKRGEYWYYTKPLSKGSAVDFCKGIQVPDFTDLPEGLAFKIISKAEAVQAAHVSLDFQSEDPFSGILIEGRSEHGDVGGETASGFAVRYENGADTIVKADDLFTKKEEIMPGDVWKDTIIIQNSNSWPIQVSIKEEGNQVDDLLLKSLHLTILRNGKEIYDGPFADNALENGILLGEFLGNSKEKLDVELSLPEESKNETAFRSIDIVLVCSAGRVKQKLDEEFIYSEEKVDTVQRMYQYPDPSVSEGYGGGFWKLVNEEQHRWEYYFENGSKAKNGWIYVWNPYSPDEDKNNWFCFNENGIMQYGWIRTENGNWYFCHEKSDGNLGKLKKGWHHDQDDKRDYYLDPVTGIMQSGWRRIEGKFYYFTPLELTKRQNWFWNTEIGRWLYDFLGYRTYGSMYKGEKTPDGYYVDEDGVWNGR